MVLGAFVAILNQTLLNVAIPRLMNAFSVSASLGTALMVTIMSERAKYHFADFINAMTSNNSYLSHLLNQLTHGLAAQLGQSIEAGQVVLGQLLYGITMSHSTIDGINDSFIVATLITIVALFLSFFLKTPLNTRTRERMEGPVQDSVQGTNQGTVNGFPEPQRTIPSTK